MPPGDVVVDDKDKGKIYNYNVGNGPLIIHPDMAVSGNKILLATDTTQIDARGRIYVSVVYSSSPYAQISVGHDISITNMTPQKVGIRIKNNTDTPRKIIIGLPTVSDVEASDGAQIMLDNIRFMSLAISAANSSSVVSNTLPDGQQLVLRATTFSTIRLKGGFIGHADIRVSDRSSIDMKDLIVSTATILASGMSALQMNVARRSTGLATDASIIKLYGRGSNQVYTRRHAIVSTT